MEDIFENMMDDVLEEMAEGTDAGADDRTFITDDKTAERAIRKIKAEIAERDRLTNVANEVIQEYTEFKRDTEMKFKRRIDNLKYHLAMYFQTVPHNKLKASEQYTLPSGKLSIKYGKTKQKYVNANGTDDKGENLVEWLEANGYDAFVKVTKAPAWAELKDAIEANGDRWYMKSTGEELDGILAFKIDDEFEVKV